MIAAALHQDFEHLSRIDARVGDQYFFHAVTLHQLGQVVESSKHSDAVACQRGRVFVHSTPPRTGPQGLKSYFAPPSDKESGSRARSIALPRMHRLPATSRTQRQDESKRNQAKQDGPRDTQRPAEMKTLSAREPMKRASTRL